MSNLFELSINYKNYLEDISELDEVNDEILETISKLDNDIEKKAENYISIIEKFEMEITYLQEKKKKLESEIKKRKRTIEYLKQNLKISMEMLEKDKIKLDIDKEVSIRNNSQYSIIIENEEAISDDFKKIEKKVDKKKILSYYKDNDLLPEGVIIKKGTHLRIK